MKPVSYPRIEDKNARLISWLLEQLEDPFSFFPIQSVGRTLRQLVEETDQDFIQRQGPHGVARKYWDIPSELLHEEIGLLLGAAFVLGQATLTQTISILSRIRQLAGTATSLPEGKAAILSLEATFHDRTHLSHLAVIDLAANFFKHHHEWPEDWNVQASKGLQARTIQNCILLGMSPREVTSNLCVAMHALGPSHSDVELIRACIQNWRGRLARRLYQELGILDPANDEAHADV